jgi:uncharacterized membrane protein YhhN
LNEPLLRYATKTLLVPVLFLYIYLNASSKHQHLNKYFYFTALLFAWLADILLLIGSEALLLTMGLFFLVLMHTANAVFFYTLKSFKRTSLLLLMAAVFVLVVIDTLLYEYLQLRLGNFKWPIIGYIVIASLSLLFAVNVLFSNTKKRLALKFFVPGMLLLTLSAFVLITNRFIVKEAFLEVVVAISCGYGQVLLMEGAKKIVQV